MKINNFLQRKVFDLSIWEWMVFISAFSFFTVATVIGSLRLEVMDTQQIFSISAAYIASFFCLLGSWLLVKGNKLGFILESFNVLLMALVLILGKDPIYALGIFYLLIPFPMLIASYYKHRKGIEINNKVRMVEGKTKNKTIIYSIALAITIASCIWVSMFYGLGAQYIIESGIGNSWAIGILYLEILSITFICFTMFFFMKKIRNSWLFFMIADSVTISLLMISFFTSSAPNAGYIVHAMEIGLETILVTVAFIKRFFFMKVNVKSKINYSNHDSILNMHFESNKNNHKSN